jgi:hypothetical protein
VWVGWVKENKTTAEEASKEIEECHWISHIAVIIAMLKQLRTISKF